MTTTNTNTPSPDPKPDGGDDADVVTLKKSLQAARQEHKEFRAKVREGRVAMAKALALPEDAGDSEILTMLADPTKAADGRISAITAERDQAAARAADAEAKATKVASEWDAHRIDSALSDSLGKCRMRADAIPDAKLLAKGLFEIDAKTGRVVTKAADGVVPGMDPAQWIEGQLKAMRPAYWLPSVGGGASGNSRGGEVSRAADTSMFDPKSPAFNVTAQHQFARQFGADAAVKAASRFGGAR